MADKPSQRYNCYVWLACSVGSLSLAWGSLFQIPNTTDRISLQRGLFLIAMGFIHFVSLTVFCIGYLLDTKPGIKFRKKYRLMMSDVMELTNKIVSAIQAFFSFLVGFIVCKSTCSKSFVYASHCLMEAYGWFGCAYFIYDIWSMYKVHTQKIADKLQLMRITASACKPKAADEIYDYDGETVEIPKDGKWDFLKYVVTHPVMMIHHIFIGTFGLLVVTYIRGGGHCIYSYMFMMEFSTPFVSIRSILSTLGLKDTRAYIVNGLLMMGSFFICRVLVWPYVMYRYSVAINLSFWQSIVSLPRGCIISILILFLPQLYWFFLIVKGAVKVLLPKKCRRKKRANNSQPAALAKEESNHSLSSSTTSNSDSITLTNNSDWNDKPGFGLNAAQDSKIELISGQSQ